jgi:hypothetical protein
MTYKRELNIVPIDNIRVGQIWAGFEEPGIGNKYARAFVVKKINSRFMTIGSYWQTDADGTDNFHIYLKRFPVPINRIKCNALIGFLGKTHEIKGGKLVEIPRGTFNVGDILMYKENDLNYIASEYISCHGDLKFIIVSRGGGSSNWCLGNMKNFKKIGVYGVTHELILDVTKEVE